MEVTKQSLGDKLNFISEKIEAAFAWACFYAKSGDKIYINGDLYECVLVFNGRLSFLGTNKITENGNWYCMNNLKTNQCLYASMERVEEVRRDNSLTHDYICFSEKQFYNMLSV